MPENEQKNGAVKTQKKHLSKKEDTTSALGKKEERNTMRNAGEKDRQKEAPKHGSAEDNGYCLVTLHEINSLIYMNGQKDCAIIAGQKLSQDLPPQIVGALTMLLQDQTAGSTQFQIWSSAVVHATLKSQINNARLIAAAPELLEALELAQERINDLKGWARGRDVLKEKIDAAIKKARGES